MSRKSIHLLIAGVIILFVNWRVFSHLPVNWGNVEQLTSADAVAWEPAATDFETGLFPTAAAMHRLSGRRYVSQADLGAAQKAYQNAVAINPQDYLAHLALADVYDQLGEPELAVYHYDQVPFYPNILPEHNHWYERLIWNKLALAEQRWGENRPEEALDLLDDVFVLHPNNLTSLVLQAKIQAERGDVTAVQSTRSRLAHYKLSFWQDPRLLDKDLQMLATMLPQTVWDEERARQIAAFLIWYAPQTNWVTESVSEMVGQRANDLAWQLLQGELYRRRHETEQAIAHYMDLTVIYPEAAQPQLQLGLAHLQAAAATADIARRAEYRDLAAHYLQQYHQLAPQDWRGARLLDVMTAQPAQPLLSDAGLADLLAQMVALDSGLISIGPPIALPIPNTITDTGWVQYGNVARIGNGLFWGGIDSQPPGDTPLLRLQAEFEPQADQRYVFGYRYESARLTLPPAPFYALLLSYQTEGLESPRAQVTSWGGPGFAGPTLRLPHTQGIWRQVIWLFPASVMADQALDYVAAFRLPRTGTLYLADVYLLPVQMSAHATLEETGVYLLLP